MMNDSGVVRPILTGAVQDDEGIVHTIPFLLNTGAEQTILSYEVVALLGAEKLPSGHALQGISGTIPSVSVATTIWFLNELGQPVPFKGKFGGITDPAFSDMSLLGRDVLRELSVIVDRPGDVVSLLAGRHRYHIQEY